MTVERRPFQASDVHALRIYEQIPDAEQERAGLYYEKWKPNVTGIIDGKIVACGGLRILWDGVGEVWLMVSRDYPIHAVVLLKRQMYEWMRDYGLRRVQSIVRFDWKEGNRFAQWSGMKFEGVMRKMYCDGSDANLWAVTR